MVAYMAGLVEFEHSEYELPDQQDVPAYVTPNIPDYNNVKTSFKKRFNAKRKKPEPLLTFLGESYPELEADEMLFLYQKLISDTDIEISQSDEKMRVKIAGQHFSLFPFNTKPVDPKHNQTGNE